MGSQMLCIRCRDLSNYGRRVHRSFMEAARLPSRPLNNDSSVSSKRMGIFQIRDVYFDHEIHEKKSQSFSLVFYDCLCSMFQNSKNNERSGIISRLLVVGGLYQPRNLLLARVRKLRFSSCVRLLYYSFARHTDIFYCFAGQDRVAMFLMRKRPNCCQKRQSHHFNLKYYQKLPKSVLKKIYIGTYLFSKILKNVVY